MIATRLFAVLALGLAFLPALASGQQNWSGLNPWKVVCDQGGACQVRNALIRGGREVSHIYIYRLGQAEIVEVGVPLGLDIRAGVALRVDRRDRFAAQLLTCKPNGCIAFTSINTTMLKSLAAGGEVDVIYTDSDSGKRKAFTYSLVGFTRSYNTFYER